jgi:hypothetical protein
MVYKNSCYISQRIYFASVIKKRVFILYKEIIPVDQNPSCEASQSINSTDYGSEGSLPLSQQPDTGLCPEPD